MIKNRDESSAVPSVLQLWDDYMPLQFREPHPALIRRTDIRSYVIARRAIDSENRELPNTVYFKKITSETKFSNSFFSRAINRLRRPLDWAAYNSFCIKQIADIRPSAIHVHFGTTASRMIPTVKKAGVPSFVIFYGVDVSATLLDPRWRKAYREMYEIYDRMIVLCEAAGERLVRDGCSPSKIRVWNLPAGIEDYTFHKRREVTNQTKGEVRFIIVARYVEKKGHFYLIDAMKKMIQAGRKVRLTMVGYGRLRPQIQNKVEEAGISQFVEIHDTAGMADFPAFCDQQYKNHDIFVLPSTTGPDGDDEGGTALCLVQAQYAGLPVICTPFVGSDTSVFEGVNGLFCKQDDSDSLAERMGYLMDHPELWNSFGAAGHSAVVEKFSLPTQIEQLVELYKEVL